MKIVIFKKPHKIEIWDIQKEKLLKTFEDEKRILNAKFSGEKINILSNEYIIFYDYRNNSFTKTGKKY